MKTYYAIFYHSKEGWEVEFPDLPGCLTFGDTMKEAVEMAHDALAAWYSAAEPEFKIEPSEFRKIQKVAKEKHSQEETQVMSIILDQYLLDSYSDEPKRFNVIFPLSVLNRVDRFRKQIGLKRSEFLLRSVEEYMSKPDQQQG